MDGIPSAPPEAHLEAHPTRAAAVAAPVAPATAPLEPQRRYLFLDFRHVQPGDLEWLGPDGRPLPVGYATGLVCHHRGRRRRSARDGDDLLLRGDLAPGVSVGESESESGRRKGMAGRASKRGVLLGAGAALPGLLLAACDPRGGGAVPAPATRPVSL
jgi:hypothetical protein